MMDHPPFRRAHVEVPPPSGTRSSFWRAPQPQASLALATVHVGTDHLPLACVYLRQAVMAEPSLNRCVNVQVHNFCRADIDNEIAARRILRDQPRVVGLSTYVWNIERILQLAYTVKMNSPGTCIVLGGPEVTPVARRILEEHPYIDMVVRGEGEQTLPELLQRMLRPDYAPADLQTVLGLTYRVDHSGIRETPDRPALQSLDDIPSVHPLPDELTKAADICVETMRGCPFRCGFCFYSKGCAQVRYFSLDRIQHDLRLALASDIRGIYLMDPTFNLDRERSKQILRFLADQNVRRVPCHTELKAELLDAEMVDLLSQANVVELEIGLQSTDPETLARIRRTFNAEKFAAGIRLVEATKNVSANVSIIYGLPGDTRPAFQRTVEYLLDVDPNIISIFRLCMIPGTDLWCRAKEFGIEYEARPPYRVVVTPTFGLEDVIYAQKVGNSLNYFRMDTIKSLRQHLRCSLWDLMDEWFDWIGNEEELVRMDTNAAQTKARFGEFVREFCDHRGVAFPYAKTLQQELTDSFIYANHYHDAFAMYKTRRKCLPGLDSWPG